MKGFLRDLFPPLPAGPQRHLQEKQPSKAALLLSVKVAGAVQREVPEANQPVV
jgi:hypothetical protein